MMNRRSVLMGVLGLGAIATMRLSVMVGGRSDHKAACGRDEWWSKLLTYRQVQCIRPDGLCVIDWYEIKAGDVVLITDFDAYWRELKRAAFLVMASPDVHNTPVHMPVKCRLMKLDKFWELVEIADRHRRNHTKGWQNRGRCMFRIHELYDCIEERCVVFSPGPSRREIDEAGSYALALIRRWEGYNRTHSIGAVS